MEENGRRRPPDRGRRPPIANQFALGYTYQDVLDADQDGTCLSVKFFAHEVLIFTRYPCSLVPLSADRSVAIVHAAA